MSRAAAEERIAQLQARAQAQRLAAQLAILEAREQLAPLRSAAGVIGAAAQALSPSGGRGLVGLLAKLGLRHPSIAATLAVAGWRLARRRPLALLTAACAGAVAWWLFRPTSTRGAAEPAQ